jgi:aspartate aminotransferase-like enzyme
MSNPTGRHFLQIPGPINVPDRVLRAMDMPTMDHRGAEFAQLTRDVIGGMKQVFKTAADVVIFPTSGTGAWETTLVNMLSPGTGLGKVQGKVFRIGHPGDFNNLMPLGTLGGVEMGLANAQVPFNKGGVDAALDYLANNP